MPEAINVLYESLSGDPPARVLRGPKQSMFYMIASGTVVALRTMPIEVPEASMFSMIASGAVWTMR
jgi:hypothetical protein